MDIELYCMYVMNDEEMSSLNDLDVLKRSYFNQQKLFKNKSDQKRRTLFAFVKR